jgi:hypothetical protein
MSWFVYFSVLVEAGLSSNNILEAGEKSSSNWPDLTPHKKAIKKMAATEMLAIKRIRITLIRFY